jgi:cysteinyl-tRNA synthetase
MALSLYNTYAKKEEEFVPLTAGKVGMYTCGPTVYGRPHIGNYSSFLMADLLRRWLEVGHGLQVTHVKNITDVGHLIADADSGEDKIEKQARAEKVDPLAIARKYTEQYLEDEKALNMLEPAARPKATEAIPEMIAIILELLKGGHAYETEDGIYFSVETYPQYGRLSGNTLEKLAAGSRVVVDENKRHPADFALWKKTVGGNAHHLLRWKFPSGERIEGAGEDPSTGFPGWHIECSAMARKILGMTFDIHTGGEDNIFPHHECELAQSECSGGKPFVRYWLHKRRIDLAGEKMSKSLGNVLTIPDIVARGYSALDLRYYLLSVHYRTNLKFTWKGMDDAHKARRKIAEWIERQRKAGMVGDKEEGIDTPDLTLEMVRGFDAVFTVAMDADLNTSGALAAVFDCMTASNRSSVLVPAAQVALVAFQEKISRTFGCFSAQQEAIPAQVQSLVDARTAARGAKDFAASDRLRDEIHALGYEVRDAKGVQEVRKL